MGTFHMALHKIHGTFEVTKSKDSTWKEWLSEEEYIYDELEKIFLIKSESFENMRRPTEDWKKTISKKELLLKDLSSELQQKLLNIKQDL